MKSLNGAVWESLSNEKQLGIAGKRATTLNALLISLNLGSEGGQVRAKHLPSRQKLVHASLRQSMTDCCEKSRIIKTTSSLLGSLLLQYKERLTQGQSALSLENRNKCANHFYAAWIIRMSTSNWRCQATLCSCPSLNHPAYSPLLKNDSVIPAIKIT